MTPNPSVPKPKQIVPGKCQHCYSSIIQIGPSIWIGLDSQRAACFTTDDRVVPHKPLPKV